MIIDHTGNAGFGRLLYDALFDSFDRATDLLDDVHIDASVDDAGYVITGGGMRVDVYPPGADEDRPGAFAAISETNLDAGQARVVAGLLLVAAEYMAFLARKAAGNG